MSNRQQPPLFAQNALTAINAAIACSQEGNLGVALQKYREALQLLNAAQKFEHMLPDQRVRLEQYIVQVEAQVRTLEERGVQPPPVSVPPLAPQMQQPSAQATASTPQQSDKDIAIVHSLWRRQSARQPAPQLAVSAKSVGSAPQQQPPAAQKDEPSSAPKSAISKPARTSPKHSPPPPTRQSDGIPKPLGPPSEQKWAPRASDLVLKSIDVATKLVQQKMLKNAIDVLQHAIDIGSHEHHNPANFKHLELTALQLRDKFVKETKPRMVQDNQPTQEEWALLRASGRTNRLLLPIWNDVNEGYPRENVFIPVREDTWVDPGNPKLSPSQLKRNATYERPVSWIESPDEPVIIRAADPMNIRQIFVPDCSLICSIIVCASFQQRFPSAGIIDRVIYPQTEDGKPIVNRRGKYCVKMLLNGIPRLVAIDDRFPADLAEKKLLCSHTKDPTELWVSIIEKAFIKVRSGTYDFPGSTSSSDMYALSGWLPDYCGFDSDDFDAAKQWVRLKLNWERGAMLITVSTPKNLEQIVVEKLKLVAEHAYAVLALKEVQGHKLVKIKNPWACQSWEGLFSITDNRRCTEDLLQELQFTPEEAEQGVFWMSWADVVKFFGCAHLSWNPYLLYPKNGLATKPTRIACHSLYVHTNAPGAHPQFHIKSNAQKPTRMHLVFCRHIVSDDPEPTDGEEKKLFFVLIEVFDTTGFPSAYSVVSQKSCDGVKCVGRRIYHGVELPDTRRIAFKSCSTLRTLSFDCPAGPRDFTILANQYDVPDGTKFAFTATLHTELPEGPKGAVMHAIPLTSLPHVASRKGEWKRGVSCGGRINSQSYVYNPQWRFTLMQPSHIICHIQATCSAAVQVHVVRRLPEASSGMHVPWEGRIQNVTHSNASAAFQCPVYTWHCAVADSVLPSCVRFNSDVKVEPPPSPPSKLPVTLRICSASAPPCEIKATFCSAAPIDSVFPFALAQNILAGPLTSKIVVNNTAVERSHETTFQQACVASQSTIPIVPLTENLPRTKDLSGCEAKLFEIARSAVAFVTSIEGKTFGDAESKTQAGLLDLTQKLILQLDASYCTTDDVKATRKAIICAGQSVERFLDQAPASCGIDPGTKPSSPSELAVGDRMLTGEYTIVASAFSKGVPGTFTLYLESETDDAIRTLEEIPLEGAGYIEQVVQGTWATDAHSFSILGKDIPNTLSAPFFRNPTLSLRLKRKGIFCCRVLALDVAADDPEPSMFCCLFRIAGGNDPVEVVAHSGHVIGPICAITPLVLDEKGHYRIVVSTITKTARKFAVRCYSSGPIEECCMLSD